MPPSTVKRVLLYRFDRQPAEGIVQPLSCFAGNHVEVISPDGNLQNVAYQDLKAVCFVSEASEPDLFTANSLFERRPKSAGLWTRFTFRDGDQLDGILAHNLLEWPADGYVIVPPHAGANRQRAFLPREALINAELRGIVGASAGASQIRRRLGTPPDSQLNMFD